MRLLNQMKLNFLSRSSNESFARVAAAAFVSQLDPTVDEIADIKTAVSEAVTNSIVHAYPNALGMVYITISLYEGGKVVIRVRDRGRGIDDIEQAMEPMFTTCVGDERAGLGFAVMQTFMDKVRVLSRGGRGTTVVLEKILDGRSAVDE